VGTEYPSKMCVDGFCLPRQAEKKYLGYIILQQDTHFKNNVHLLLNSIKFSMRRMMMHQPMCYYRK